MKGTKPRLVIDNESVSKAPKTPAWLSDHAKTECRRVLPILIQRKILTVADLGSLENYCIAIGKVREMEVTLQAEGHVVSVFKENAEGQLVCLGMKRHPAVGVQSDAMNRARLLAAELGLTPVSRSRPAMRPESEANEFDDMDL